MRRFFILVAALSVAGIVYTKYIDTGHPHSEHEAHAGDGGDHGGHGVHVPKQHWSFSGPFGTYNMAALQRGFQVYKEVCATCHALDLIHYRNLESIGFTEDEVKAIAEQDEIKAGPNDEGEYFLRPGIPADKMVKPYPNIEMARASNNGAAPPDLSLMTKARLGGPDYLYALLSEGYVDPPEGFQVLDGLNYNKYFSGNQIAMVAPLTEGQVEYTDGTQETVAQMSRDVCEFLMWTADPHMVERKRMGIKVILFLIIMTGLLYAAKRRIWSDLH